MKSSCRKVETQKQAGSSRVCQSLAGGSRLIKGWF
ncbi:hypothetical protein E2C01_082930 [Portunus trituberculatus]|uniref:Uncharacterized protein n=1 Tax=Portunus trituberculatus TaxID=210409 RepID=A0A5B7ITK1_PORTR|nr:hypothetical protein [Portunus trituberculatus]